MNKKAIIFSIAVSLLVVVALFVFPSWPDRVNAQTSNNNGSIVGWMWSSNVGWFRADSNAADPVKVGADGQWSGFAWSPSLGWLDFNPTTTSSADYPGEPRHGVQSSGNSVTGWARLCSVFKTGCKGELKSNNELGSWNGWVKMVNVTKNPTTGGLEGYAWGDLNLGWLKFGCFTGNCNVITTCPADSLVDTNGDGIEECCSAWQSCVGGGPGDNGVSCTITTDNPSASGHASLGENITWSVSGDFIDPEKAYTYTWTGDFGLEPNPDPRTENTPTFVNYYNTAGTYHMHVKVSDGATEKEADCSTTQGDGGIIVDNSYDLIMACPGGKIVSLTPAGSDNETICDNASYEEPTTMTYPATDPLTQLSIRSIADAGSFISPTPYTGQFCTDEATGLIPYVDPTQPVKGLCRPTINQTGHLNAMFGQTSGCSFDIYGSTPGDTYYPIVISLMYENLPRSSTYEQGQRADFTNCGQGADTNFGLSFEVARIDPNTLEELGDFTYNKESGTGIKIFCNGDGNQDKDSGGCGLSELSGLSIQLRGRIYSMPDGPATVDGTYYYVVKPSVILPDGTTQPLDKNIYLEFQYSVGS